LKNARAEALGRNEVNMRTIALLAVVGAVRGGQTASLEGDQPKRIVMIAFDSMAQAQAWYDSPAYHAIRPIRLQSAKSRVYIVEGAPEVR